MITPKKSYRILLCLEESDVNECGDPIKRVHSLEYVVSDKFDCAWIASNVLQDLQDVLETIKHLRQYAVWAAQLKENKE